MMINKENLKNFINKTIFLKINNGFRYKGKIISIEDETIIFNDRKVGECLFDINSVDSIIPTGDSQ